MVTGAVAARLPEAVVALPPTPLVVDTDPRRLDRIMGNLLDNARDHAPGAPVEVALQPTRDGVVIVVADRGPGVPGDALPHLFERFYKADPSRAAGSSGLGLAIAAEHAALLGGSLRARARPGGGMVFALTLPVTGSLPPGDAPDRIGSMLAALRNRTEARTMSPLTRIPVVVALLVAVALTVAACTPATGPLGTPAAPVAPPASSG